ncbi:MAG TPA: hypothetical protein VEL07_14370 [Planctomycetota bacterium]|nr:hypothetical protein [Planctomycetota bacterium]
MVWLFCRQGFLSAVCARKDEGRSRELDVGLIMVRSRSRAHLEGVVRAYPTVAWLNPDAPVKLTSGTDYPARAFLPKPEFVKLLAAIATDVDYDNVKVACGAVHGPRSTFLSCMHTVWSVMTRLEHPPSIPRAPGGPNDL